MKFSPISVLSQIQNLVSKSVYRAISIILYPCCEFTGTASVTCNEDNTYAVSITTDQAIGYFGKGVATLNVANTISTGVVTEPKTIFVETLTTSAGTKDVIVTLILPTNVAGTTAVTQTFTLADVVFPSCV